MEFHAVLLALKERVYFKFWNALTHQEFFQTVEVEIKNTLLHLTKYRMTSTVMELPVASAAFILLIHGLTNLIKCQKLKRLVL